LVSGSGLAKERKYAHASGSMRAVRTLKVCLGGPDTATTNEPG
jgi:hypothetical protein